MGELAANAALRAIAATMSLWACGIHTHIHSYLVLFALREVLNAREQERRQEVTPPVARTRRTRSEVSDDDEGDDDDDANSVGAGAAA